MQGNVAIYLRSSNEQDEKTRNVNNPDESDTIANQRKYLIDHAISKGFAKEQIREYVDDGHTGTNFVRPAFMQMLKDIENGQIRTVIVKDFSRLGRDYIGVGEYVEQYFPLHRVRIISVNDNWDSDEHVGETMELDTTFRTIIYEMFSRDLSVKLKSSVQARNKQGIFSWPRTPFGYKKDPTDKHKVIVDEEYAPTVRRIFSMYNSGVKIGDIAKILTDEGVPTPGMSKDHIFENSTIVRGRWNETAIRRILGNETYTGTLVLNRMKSKEFRGPSIKRDKSEWLRFPDDHEAIISREEFEKTCRRRHKFKNPVDPDEMRFYPLFCGHCGAKFKRTTTNEKTFACRHGKKNPADACGQIEIRIEKMEELLIKAINAQAQALLDKPLNKRGVSKATQRLEEKIAELMTEQKSCHDERMNLYARFKSGEIDKATFFEKKVEVLKKEEACLAEIETKDEQLSEIKKTLELFGGHENRLEKYAVLSEYDQDVVNMLIEGVYVYNDGHIRIKWSFQSGFGEYQDEEDNVDGLMDEVDSSDEVVNPTAVTRIESVAIYTSELFIVPESESDNDREEMEKFLTSYAEKTMGIPHKRLTVFSDSKYDDELYYRSGYMKFLDAGRSGRVDALLVRCFRDMYLSFRQLKPMLFEVIPNLPCRFISVEDGFDSGNASEEQYRELYEKYKGVRTTDRMRWREWERKQGLRVAKETVLCSKLYGYRIEEDGCYAVLELLENVKKIYAMAMEHGNMKPVIAWLNSEKIMNSKEFFIQQGDKYEAKYDPGWNKVKVINLIKNREYVQYCSHYEKCMEQGRRHCEKMPIVDQQTYDEVLEICKKRLSDSES